MLTVVDPDRPPTEPAMSLAWMMTEYISLVSLSMFGKAVRMTPVTQRAEIINIAAADLHNPYPIIGRYIWYCHFLQIMVFKNKY